MEIQRHTNQTEEENEGDYEICELMTDSAVMENKQSQINEDYDHDQKVPSIIRNLQQSDPITRISQILGSYNVDLYQQQMKTIRTLGIIPQEKSQMEFSNQISNKQKIEQDDVSTKFNTTQSSHTLHKLDSNSLTCFTNYPQSQIGQIYTIYKIKQNLIQELFTSKVDQQQYSKLEITSDSFNIIEAKLKLKPKNLSTFFESLKSIQEENVANFCLSYISNAKSLKLNMSSHPKYTHKLYKFYNQYNKHSNLFKEYLWENNCIETSQNQAIQLTFIKQRDSIVQLKKEIKRVLKEQKNQIQLQNCLAKLLQLRELFLFQIQGKGIKFNKPNPLVQIEKKFLIELDLYSIYKQYFAKDQEKYENKKHKINQKYKLKQIYSYLKIPDCQRLVDAQGDSPYEQAIKQLDNFLIDPYPHLFLFNIQKFYNTLQMCKEANSKTSISSDIEGQRQLGLVILCLIQSSAKDSYHKIRFIEHYLKLTDNSKYEQMCLNLPLGLDYIQNSWETC